MSSMACYQYAGEVLELLTLLLPLLLFIVSLLLLGVVAAEVLLLVTLLEWCELPIKEVTAVANAAAKLGSAVRAFTVSPIDGNVDRFWDIWRPENFDWLYKAWPKI